MKTFRIVGKAIGDCDFCQQMLRDNGYHGAIVACAESVPSVVTVYTDDNSPDPTAFINAYAEPPLLNATSDHPDGPFGHAQGNADGLDTQLITVITVDAVTKQPKSWSGNVLVQPMSPIMVNPKIVPIVNGIGTFRVGPTPVPGEYDIYIQRQGDTVGTSRFRLHLMFF
jgi:hypothetical protein